MKRLLCCVIAFSFLLTTTGCGDIFVRGAINTGSSTVTGFVSIVQFTTVFDDGSSFLVTFVTFLDNGTSSTIGFCGDQRSQFPFNQMVRTQFTSGTPCANLIVVVII